MEVTAYQVEYGHAMNTMDEVQSLIDDLYLRDSEKVDRIESVLYAYQANKRARQTQRISTGKEVG